MNHYLRSPISGIVVAGLVLTAMLFYNVVNANNLAHQVQVNTNQLDIATASIQPVISGLPHMMRLHHTYVGRLNFSAVKARDGFSPSASLRANQAEIGKARITGGRYRVVVTPESRGILLIGVWIISLKSDRIDRGFWLAGVR